MEGARKEIRRGGERERGRRKRVRELESKDQQNPNKQCKKATSNTSRTLIRSQMDLSCFSVRCYYIFTRLFFSILSSMYCPSICLHGFVQSTKDHVKCIILLFHSVLLCVAYLNIDSNHFHFITSCFFSLEYEYEISLFS